MRVDICGLVRGTSLPVPLHCGREREPRFTLISQRHVTLLHRAGSSLSTAVERETEGEVLHLTLKSNSYSNYSGGSKGGLGGRAEQHRLQGIPDRYPLLFERGQITTNR